MTNRKFLCPILTVLSIGTFLFCTCEKETTESDSDSALEPEWIECQNTEVDTTTYFVSASGNNQSNGTSVSTAFRTLAQAFQTVSPGGTINILPGTYTESLGILQCGSDKDTIHITGYQGTPVLDGQDKKTMGIYCEECTNLIFEKLTIQNYTDMGIGFSECEDITLRNLTVRENGHRVQLVDWELEGYGIHAENSRKVTIIQNNVYRNGPEPKVIPDRILGTGIDTYGNVDVLIKDNKSYQNIGGGILVEDSKQVLVENNEVYENDLDATADEWWDGGLWLDGGEDVTVRNNIFRDNLGPGIEISDEDLQKPTGYVLENNESTNNYYGIFIWNFGTSSWPPDSVLTQSGNQFTDNLCQDVWIEAWDSDMEIQPCQ